MTPRVMMVFVLLSGFSAFAQATRTWVSGVGDDANPCSRTAPCKTFAGAISKTAAGGEINALDPGGFGAVTITKAITINAVNVTAGVLVAGTNGVVINAPTTATVTLRGLDFMGLDTGLCAVRVIQAGAVHVEDSTISGFTQGGVCDASASNLAPNFFIKNVTITRTTNAANPAAAVSVLHGVAVLDHVRLMNNDVGISVAETAKVTIANSTIAGNSVTGLSTDGTAAVSVERTVFAANGTGIYADAGSTLLSDSNFSFNDAGFTGPVFSYGNNRLNAGNVTDGVPAGTLPQQ